MSLSTSRIYYESHLKLLERALSSPHGIRIQYKDWGYCNRMRTEFHMARQIDRDENKITYEEGEKMHGRSVYDGLRCTIWVEKTTDDPCWLYIQKIDAEKMAAAVEEITFEPSIPTPPGIEDAPKPAQIEQSPQLAIEDRTRR